MKKSKGIKSWQLALTIPNYLIQNLSDCGAEEFHHSDGLIEKDDLRVAFELSGGHHVLIPTNGRVVVAENGDVEIEVLK